MYDFVKKKQKKKLVLTGVAIGVVYFWGVQYTTFFYSKKKIWAVIEIHC